MVELKNLNFHYGGVQALWNVNMSMPAARITCIMGRNGVGKTTLLKNIMGVQTPSDGSIALDDRDVTKMPANKRARAGIALVPQGRQIFPKLSVLEKTTNGFEIAEADWELRGPGDLLGTAQSGLPELKLGDLRRDAALMRKARQAALELLENDPGLDCPQNQRFRDLIVERQGQTFSHVS